ncbi:hypothetical protein PYCCODRAFT_1477526 [Trametes coccinea BRFM310]|uniref:Uncharacterized protein n=1 Tax=Trametes coccinea (strain BRFM310) TaxID=1353009 RepID=A0A1Y2IP48_TRAC3|nr:hypothetical protein PYCCODRAFT_1477526 [Trametes coccinea BRFM310]
MASTDIEALAEKQETLEIPLVAFKADGPAEPTTTEGAQGQQSWPYARLAEHKERLLTKLNKIYPRVLDTLYRIAKLCCLTFMVIFVVMLASWFMALFHWFTVVLGHIVLRYATPPSIDDSFAKGRIDNTMIFAGIGAFIVNSPPFIIFLLSFPFTFNRSAVESGAASANGFIKRIMPENRYALLFLQYAPKMVAGPLGCVIMRAIDGDNSRDGGEILDPLHAAFAGLAGEAVLTACGRARARLFKKKARTGEGNTDKNCEVLPI